MSSEVNGGGASEPPRSIGVLTSGGDAPGMNACIAAIARFAEKRGVAVRGIFGGFAGLAEGNSIPVGGELAGLSRRGGTFLGTARNGEVEKGLRSVGAAEAVKRCCVDGLIVLGGGGSLNAAARVAQQGVPVIGIPCTIDNDVPGTEFSIGFDTAVNKAVRAADEILDTAESLSNRVFVIETLGGTTGHIAIAAAYAAGADAVFVHEIPPDVDAAALRIKAKMDAGATHGLVVLCEGLGTDEISRKLESATGRRVRVTALGHAQRGGNPSFLDRMLAREFGEATAEWILGGFTDSLVVCQNGATARAPLSEAVSAGREIDLRKYEAVNGG